MYSAVPQEKASLITCIYVLISHSVPVQVFQSVAFTEASLKLY